MFGFRRLARDNPHSTLRSLAATFARELGVEYVMIGILENYIERVGSASGIERPASVGLRLYLMHAATESVVFEGSFEETQQALSENVLRAPTFFKRGARWLTAGELVTRWHYGHSCGYTIVHCRAFTTGSIFACA